MDGVEGRVWMGWRGRVRVWMGWRGRVRVWMGWRGRVRVWMGWRCRVRVWMGWRIERVDRVEEGKCERMTCTVWNQCFVAVCKSAYRVCA